MDAFLAKQIHALHHRRHPVWLSPSGAAVQHSAGAAAAGAQPVGDGAQAHGGRWAGGAHMAGAVPAGGHLSRPF